MIAARLSNLFGGEIDRFRTAVDAGLGSRIVAMPGDDHPLTIGLEAKVGGRADVDEHEPQATWIVALQGEQLG